MSPGFGTLANGNSRGPAISADGRYVAFDSSASNLVPNDTNGEIGGFTGLADVFLRDTCIGAPTGCVPSTMRVSVGFDGSEASGDSRRPSLSADGRFVVFHSGASNLVPDDTNGVIDVFLRDTCIRASSGCTPNTTRVSVDSEGRQANSDSFFQAISQDGRYVVFHSFASNLVAGDTNSQPDVFLRDTCVNASSGCTPITRRASVASDGTQANDRDFLTPAINGDGRFVAFSSFATNLVSGDTNGVADVFYRDTCIGAAPGCVPSTIRAAVAFDGSQANDGSAEPAVSGDGRFVVFDALATNLIPGGLPVAKSVFLRDTCWGEGVPAECVPTTILLSMTTDGVAGNGNSELPVISADGRFAAFISTSTNLLPGVGNGKAHIYLARTGF